MGHTCENCGIKYEKQYNRKRNKGRRKFCSQLCYRLFNTKHKKQRDHHYLYNDFRRLVWGSTGLTQGGVDKIKSFDYRKYELIAKNKLLAEYGFTEILDMNELFFGFNFDFIAKLGNKKVLIDITTKYSTNNKTKKQLADALGIDFYMLFISPEYDGMHHLHKMTTPTYKIPQQFFKDIAAAKGIDTSKYFIARP